MLAFLLLGALAVQDEDSLRQASSNFEQKYIDVSVWQGDIDWPTVAQSISGVMIRCGYGSYNPSQIDTKFERNINGAYEQGMKIGIYHYSYANGVSAASDEADFCLSIINPHKSKITLPVAYDLEEQSIADLGVGTVTQMALTFCQKIRDAGYMPMIYTNLNWATNYIDMSQIDAAGIYVWMAQWYSSCTYGGNYVMWQYGTSYVNGVGEVDSNWCYTDFGTAPSGGSSSGGSSEGSSEGSSTGGSTISYTVQAGDTLWGISQVYGCSIDSIVALNNIANPNLIYVGQVLLIPSSNSVAPEANAEKMIDVSVWNGDIQWSSVATQISGVMIRCGYGSYNPSQIDNKFEANIKGAYAAGLKIGIYHYSYANGVSAAKDEADFCLSIINPHKSKITLPVTYDLEEQSIANLGKSTVTQMALAWCAKIKAAGYMPMIYTNLNWATNYIDMSQINAAGIYVWMAQWGSRCTYSGTYHMWQYSETGSVSGISGSVDMNWCYTSFSGGSSSGSSTASVLAKGSSGSEVTTLQNMLNKCGYNCGTADGIFGTNTYSAVMAMQTDWGLDVDGVYGAQSRAALSAMYSFATSTSLLQQGSSGSDVTVLQTMLNKLGHSCGTADGVFGANTASAVKAFQTKKSLDVDGIVGSATRSALIKAFTA